jgi:hypothetical protein
MKWKRFAKYEHNWFYFSSPWMMIWCWFNLSNANFIQYNFLHHFTSNIYDLSSLHCKTYLTIAKAWRVNDLFLLNVYQQRQIARGSNFGSLMVICCSWSTTVPVYQTFCFDMIYGQRFHCLNSTLPHGHVSLLPSTQHHRGAGACQCADNPLNWLITAARDWQRVFREY